MNYRTLSLPAVLLALASPVFAQNSAKIDEELTRSVKAGCTTEKVIITTRPGYRAGLADSLQRHGDRVKFQPVSIDAVSAEIHCGDIETLSGFSSVRAISKDAEVRADGLAGTRAPRSTGDTTGASAASANRQDTVARTNAGKKAERGQWVFFETLGVNAARQTVTSELAMLGDVTYDTTEIDSTLVDWSGSSEPTRSAGTFGIAIIDSGIEPAIDFGNRISAFYDFTGGHVRKAAPSDAYGHGTHVAGLIASRFVGVAPFVRLVGLRVLDGKGSGQTSDVVEAIEFATANKDILGIRAINLSLGHPIFEPAATDPLVQAVERAVRAGLVVITASGNFGVNPATGLPGYAGVISPGNAPSSITVAALNTFETVSRADDRVAPYSSRGPSWYDAFAKPDVTAPGHNLLSIAAKGSYLRRLNEKRGGSGDYMRLSGTSMAAAVATGVVALTLDANGTLTPNAVKAVLEYTAIPVKDDQHEVYDALTQGTGGVNGGGAIALAAAIDASQPVGSKWLMYGVPFHTTIGRVPYQWAGSILWGPHHVRGDGVLDENRIAWQTNIVWASGVDEDNIVWGTVEPDEDNIVWGTSDDDGDNIVWGTNFVWATSDDDADNIVWGTSVDEDNIVWGTNIVWGASLIGEDDGDNIVWGTGDDDGDNIVWGTVSADNVVWGNLFESNLVWGADEHDSDNIVWGTGIIWGKGGITGARPAHGQQRRNRR